MLLKYYILFCLLFCLLFFGACKEVPAPKQVTKEPATLEKEAIPIKPVSVKEQPQENAKTPKSDYNTQLWTEVTTLDSTILLDLKYATTDNFVKVQMYDCGRCFLRPAVARRIFRAHQLLKQKDLGLKMFDCYRPKPIQQKLWDKVPNASYVTPPKKGSMHNKGAAVDLTIVDALGKELDMGTKFDYFGEKGHHSYQDLPKEVLANRQLLKRTMKEVGLDAIRTEWWHYSYNQQIYKIDDWIWACD